MRIERIEGFQPYDAFAERRIRDAITFIESTGKELSLIRKEIDLRYRLKQTTNLDKNTQSLKKSSKRTLDLQKVGEKVAVIPLAYYTYMLLDKFYKPHPDERTAIVLDPSTFRLLLDLPRFPVYSDASLVDMYNAFFTLIANGSMLFFAFLVPLSIVGYIEYRRGKDDEAVQRTPAAQRGANGSLPHSRMPTGRDAG